MSPKSAGNPPGFITLDEEKRVSGLSLALRISDADTGRPLAVPVVVRIKERAILPAKNQSGYYLFFDLAPATYSVTVEADTYEYREEQIAIPRPDKKNPVYEIKIKSEVKT
jgi:hypothetical protein